jgi:hypothetical protein
VAEKIEIKKTLKYEPTMSVMVIEAGDMERALNKVLNPLIKGYRGCHLEFEKQSTPGGVTIQFPKFIIAIDKFSESIHREQNPRMAQMLGSQSSFALKDFVREILSNFIIEKHEMSIREKQKSITVVLNFFKCMQQMFENNNDYRIKYDHVEYYKTKFSPEVKRYIWLHQMEGSLREEFEKHQKEQIDNRPDNFFYDNNYEEEEPDEEYNTDM